MAYNKSSGFLGRQGYAQKVIKVSYFCMFLKSEKNFLCKPYPHKIDHKVWLQENNYISGLLSNIKIDHANVFAKIG